MPLASRRAYALVGNWHGELGLLARVLLPGPPPRSLFDAVISRDWGTGTHDRRGRNWMFRPLRVCG
jgi:hypothetical protein